MDTRETLEAQLANHQPAPTAFYHCAHCERVFAVTGYGVGVARCPECDGVPDPVDPDTIDPEVFDYM